PVSLPCIFISFFFQAEDGIRDRNVTGVQTCALPILSPSKVEIFASVVRLPCVISTTNVSSLGNHKSINPFSSVVIVSSTTTSPDESVTNTSKSSSTNSP